MSDAPNPFENALSVQRQVTEQGYRLLRQNLELQRRAANVALDGMEQQRTVQRKGLDVAQTGFETYFDAMETMMPWGAPMIANARMAARNQFQATSDVHDSVWRSSERGLEEGVRTYEQLIDDYLAVVDESQRAHLEVLDELDERSSASRS